MSARRSLKVLVVTNTYPTRAAPGDCPQIRDQVEALKARGVAVELLYVDRYRGTRSYAAAAARIAALSFQPKHYDLLHAFYGHCGLLARLQIRYPVVVTFLGSDLLHPRDAAIGKRAARWADGVIVQSEEMRRVAQRPDAAIIPFGVNLGLFRPCPAAAARASLGLRPAEKLVLFPWDPARGVKRFDVIEAAVARVREDFPTVRIVTVFDQPHETVARYMNACDVLVLASEHEGSPMALREALACGLPIVAVDVGDVRQMLDGVDGCFICRREPADMAEKVCQVLARTASAPNGVRTSGADVMSQAHADWAAEQVLTVYDAVLGAK